MDGYSVVFLVGQQGIGNQTPRQQTFSVLDPTISFPLSPSNTISVGVSKGHLAECELTATYTNLGSNAICINGCSSCCYHSPVVLIPSEWLLHSTGLNIQFQFDWPR